MLKRIIYIICISLLSSTLLYALANRITIKLTERGDYEKVKKKWIEIHKEGDSATIILDRNCQMNVYLNQYCAVKKLRCRKGTIIEEEGTIAENVNGFFDTINKWDCPLHKCKKCCD